MTKVLFIGGPADTRYFDVPDDARSWTLAVPSSTNQEEMHAVRYFRTPIQSGYRRWDIMLIDGDKEVLAKYLKEC